MRYLLGGALSLAAVPWVLIASLGSDNSPGALLFGLLAGVVTAAGLLLLGLGWRTTRAERDESQAKPSA